MDKTADGFITKKKNAVERYLNVEQHAIEHMMALLHMQRASALGLKLIQAGNSGFRHAFGISMKTCKVTATGKINVAVIKMLSRLISEG